MYLCTLKPRQQAAANLRKVKILKKNFENCSVRLDIHFGTLKKFLIFEAAYTRRRPAGEDLGYLFVRLYMKLFICTFQLLSSLLGTFLEYDFHQKNYMI